MNLILQAIKALFRKIELMIPKKLSDLENDLWWTKKELFLELTKDDFVAWENPNGEVQWEYIASPKLDWLTSEDAIAWELSCLLGGEALNLSSEDTFVELISETMDDGERTYYYYPDAPFMINSGCDFHNWDDYVAKDQFVIQLAVYEPISDLSLKIYRVDAKKVPIEYCDTSEIEAEIDALAEEVWNS